MTSPAREIHGALYSLLSADVALNAIASKVHDRVPEDAVFPYVSFGPINGVPSNAECITASEHTVQIDTWSRAVGSGESYDMTDAVKRAIEGASIALNVNALSSIRVVSVRNFNDSSDHKFLTERGVVTVQAMIEER